jgi:hypothetical protein
MTQGSIVSTVLTTGAFDGAITRTGLQPDFTAPAAAQGKGNFTGAGGISVPGNAPKSPDGQSGQNGATIIPFTGTGISVKINFLAFIGTFGALVARMVVF